MRIKFTFNPYTTKWIRVFDKDYALLSQVRYVSARIRNRVEGSMQVYNMTRVIAEKGIKTGRG